MIHFLHARARRLAGRGTILELAWVDSKGNGEAHVVSDKVGRMALPPPGSLVYSSARVMELGWPDDLVAGLGSLRLLDVSNAYLLACRPLLWLLPHPGTPGRAVAEQRIRAQAQDLMAHAKGVEDDRAGPPRQTLDEARLLWRTWRAI